MYYPNKMHIPQNNVSISLSNIYVNIFDLHIHVHYKCNNILFDVQVKNLDLVSQQIIFENIQSSSSFRNFIF